MTTTMSGRLWLAVACLGFGAICGVAAADGSRVPGLYRLAPGGSVKDGPPKGWTARIIRSVPELATGDIESLPESSKQTATLLRTVIVADVRRGPSGFVLSRIGVGNAVPVGDRELITTTEGPAEALATLGTLEKLVLRLADSRLDEGRIVAATPTFALFRTPAVMILGGRHVDVDLSYAVLADAATGTLRTLAWASPTAAPSPPETVVELDRDATYPIPLDVRVNGRLGPLPISWSFALPELPPGRRLAVPDATARLLASPDRLTADRLERLLRGLIDGAASRR